MGIIYLKENYIIFDFNKKEIDLIIDSCMIKFVWTFELFIFNKNKYKSLLFY